MVAPSVEHDALTVSRSSPKVVPSPGVKTGAATLLAAGLPVIS